MPTKQLSRSGLDKVRLILAWKGIDPENTRYICDSTAEAGREQLLLDFRKQLELQSNAASSSTTCPTAWHKFLEREPVSATAFDFFCNVLDLLTPQYDFNAENESVIDLDADGTPRFFRKCKAQIEALHYNAIRRLELPENNWQEQFNLYKNTVDEKNFEFGIKRFHNIDRTDIYTDSPEFVSDSIFQIRLRATVKLNGGSRDVTWGIGMVNIETGRSELLLDNRPFMWEGEDVIIGGENVRTIQLPRDLRLTATAITLLEEAFELAFKGDRQISNYGGWLKDTNLTRFQTEYLKLKKENSPHTEAELVEAALLKVSFGRARLALGINRFDIKVMDRLADGLPSAIYVHSAQRQ